MNMNCWLQVPPEAFKLCQKGLNPIGVGRGCCDFEGPALQRPAACLAAVSGAMTSSNVEIFLRIKPVKHQTDKIVLNAHENKVEFVIPRDVAQGLVNNQREHYEFIFNGILTPEAKQDEVSASVHGRCPAHSSMNISRCAWLHSSHTHAAALRQIRWLSMHARLLYQVFERVARPVVNGALEGFNGTIFAYGQTGSGKTFTMTGGAERYVDRGIIPRTISAIFSEIEKRSDQQIQVRGDSRGGGIDGTFSGGGGREWVVSSPMRRQGCIVRKGQVDRPLCTANYSL